MFKLINVKNNRFGIFDTKDGSLEYVSRADIIKAMKNGTQISCLTLHGDELKGSPEMSEMPMYECTGYTLSDKGILCVNFNVYRMADSIVTYMTEKLHIDKSQIKLHTRVCGNYGNIECPWYEDDFPIDDSYFCYPKGRRINVNHFIFIEYNGKNYTIPYIVTQSEQIHLESAYKMVERRLPFFTLEGYAFEERIKKHEGMLICGNYKCKQSVFEERLRADYKECISQRKLDREASFQEYLYTCITGDWIEHNVRLAESM